MQRDPGGNREDQALIEREEELALLEEVVGSTSSGVGQVLLFTGPAGIGKSALVRSGVDRARAAGMRVLEARPSSLEIDLGFGVARQLLTDQVAGPRDLRRDALLAGGGELALPALGLGAEAEDVAEDPFTNGLFGLHRLCANLAVEQPLAIVVDDAQWSDLPSRRFLAHLAGRVGRSQILLLLAVRSGDSAAADGFVLELEVIPEAKSRRLRELGKDGSRRFVVQSFPDANEGLVAGCVAVTGGNPFYLGELVRAAVAEELDSTSSDVSDLAQLSTQALRDSLTLRIGRLGDRARQLAEALAIFPPDADNRHVFKVASLEHRPAAEAADQLERAGLLRDVSPLEFSHPIVRAAVYEQISDRRQCELHSRAAQILMDEHASAEAIVFHLLQSDPVGDPQRARVLRRAAGAAVAAGAFDEGLLYARRALAEPPEPRDRASTLREIGVAEGHLGLPEAVDHLRAAADAVASPRLRAEILRQIGWCLLTAGRFVGVAQVLEEAIAVLGPEDRGLALEIEADLVAAAQMAMLPPETVPARLAPFESLRLEGVTRGERSILAVLAFEAVRANAPSGYAAELACRALPAGGEPVDITTAVPLYLGALSLIYAEAFDDARRVLEDGLARAYAPRSVAMYRLWHAYLELALGNFEAAHESASVALAQEGSHSASVAPLAGSALAQIQVACGDVAGARDALERLGLYMLSPEEVPFEMPLYTRAMIRLESGDPASALEDALACGQKILARGSIGPSTMPWRSTAAMAANALGDLGQARRWANEELELARGFGGKKTLSIALMAAGRVAEPSEQIGLFQEAVAVAESSPALPEKARAWVEMGATLRRTGLRKDARVWLREGHELASRIGAVGLASRAHEELIAAGGRPRRTALQGPESLTPSELRITKLAADGRTNRAIAAELHLSPKTVEMHLRNAYAKLAISSRKGLTRALRDELHAL